MNIHRHRWKERLKIRKLTKFKGDTSKGNEDISPQINRFSLTVPSQKLKKPWKILWVRASHVLNDHIEMAVFSPVVDAQQRAL